MLVGLVGALRVGELVALNVEDLDARTEGVIVRVRRAVEGRCPPPTRHRRPPARCSTAWISIG